MDGTVEDGTQSTNSENDSQVDDYLIKKSSVLEAMRLRGDQSDDRDSSDNFGGPVFGVNTRMPY